MANARLLQAICTVAMLAAAPAFAQTDTAPALTGAGNSVNAPASVIIFDRKRHLRHDEHPLQSFCDGRPFEQDARKE